MQLLIAEGFNHTHKHGPDCGHTAIRREGHCARISLPVSTIDAILGPPHIDAASSLARRPWTLQARLGHRNIQRTVRYTALAADGSKNFWRR